MQTIDFKKIFAQQNRGILLDIVVFLINLLLMQILTILSRKLVYQAEQDVFAKLAIGLFFAGLFFLQPLGPVLKRWSFHQRFKFESNSTAGCLLFWFMWVYSIGKTRHSHRYSGKIHCHRRPGFAGLLPRTNLLPGRR